MIKTGFYGGSFDPIHIGHIALARQLLTSIPLDEIWFVVSPQNPFKINNNLLDDEKRLQMIRIALQDEKGLIASDYEFHLEKPSYTWKTLRALRKDFPDRDFSLIIGADNWLAFDRWGHPDEIISEHEIFVYPRENYPIDERKLPHNVHFFDAKLYPVSSTCIREKVKEGKSIQGLVPDSIADLVRKYYK